MESIAWNHMEFEVQYPSLMDEVRVGDYYLRVLLQHNQPTGCLAIDIKDPVAFFDELYRRFLTAPKPALRYVVLSLVCVCSSQSREFYYSVCRVCKQWHLYMAVTGTLLVLFRTRAT